MANLFSGKQEKTMEKSIGNTRELFLDQHEQKMLEIDIEMKESELKKMILDRELEELELQKKKAEVESEIKTEAFKKEYEQEQKHMDEAGLWEKSGNVRRRISALSNFFDIKNLKDKVSSETISLANDKLIELINKL